MKKVLSLLLTLTLVLTPPIPVYAIVMNTPIYKIATCTHEEQRKYCYIYWSFSAPAYYITLYYYDGTQWINKGKTSGKEYAVPGVTKVCIQQNGTRHGWWDSVYGVHNGATTYYCIVTFPEDLDHDVSFAIGTLDGRDNGRALYTSADNFVPLENLTFTNSF